MPAVYCSCIDNIRWDQLSPDSIALTTGVDVWRIRVSSNLPFLNQLKSKLLPDEVNRALAYYREQDSNRFVVSRGMLRYLLSNYLGQAPDSIQLVTGVNKKPALQNADIVNLHYNVAHSGDWILIAIANSGVGVDVEKIDNHFNYTEILPRSFSQQEIHFIQKEEPSRAYFYLLWTRKEALIKATAKGVDSDLEFVPCLDGLHVVEPGIIGSAEAWTVSSFEVEKQYTASIAYNPLIKNIRFLGAADELILDKKYVSK